MYVWVYKYVHVHVSLVWGCKHVCGHIHVDRNLWVSVQEWEYRFKYVLYFYLLLSLEEMIGISIPHKPSIAPNVREQCQVHSYMSHNNVLRVFVVCCFSFLLMYIMVFEVILQKVKISAKQLLKHSLSTKRLLSENGDSISLKIISGVTWKKNSL